MESEREREGGMDGTKSARASDGEGTRDGGRARGGTVVLFCTTILQKKICVSGGIGKISWDYLHGPHITRNFT